MFKIFIENVIFYMLKKLKYSYLIVVYFKVLEDIFVELWEINVSGCLFFVISCLVVCLKVRYFFYYFMFLFNFIESFLLEEINEICVNIECICMFLLIVI